MKILQVSHGLPPKENGGVENYTFYLSKELVKNGHQVIIFCREENRTKNEFSAFEEEVDGLRVRRVVNNLIKINKPRALYDNSFFNPVFLNILQKEKPDIIHFQHIFTLSGQLISVAKKAGFPVIFTIHDFFTLCPRVQLLKGDLSLCKGPQFGENCIICLLSVSNNSANKKILFKLKEIISIIINKWPNSFLINYLTQKRYRTFYRHNFMEGLLNSCDHILTPSHYLKNFFSSYFPFMRSKIEALPLGIPDFKKQGPPKKADKKIRFCYFGAILPHKGVHILIDAFKMLPDGKAVLTLYGGRITGNQGYYDKLKQNAVGYEVVFRGPFQREDLPCALFDQDIMIMPAIWPETFSIVIREANLLGLPVIASRIGALTEAVQEGINGFLFNPGDIDDLRNLMTRFIEDPDSIKRMVSRMQKPKSIIVHTEELIKIYKRIIYKHGETSLMIKGAPS